MNMETDFISSPDSKFLADNMLCGDDLDAGVFDELGDFDLEANFGSDELFNSLNADFQIPLWDSPSLQADEPWMNIDDNSSDSGISGVSIKQEPLSPASSSSSENDLLMTQMPTDILQPDYRIQLPMTPPRDAQDPPSPTMCEIKTEVLTKPVLDVLNTKTKIQPKPPQVAGSVTTKPVPTKPLVLTAQEFAKLTAQGVLRFNPPVKEAKPGAAASPPPQVIQTDEEVKVIKRQQRMIKNRESACLSRRRRKEYMNGLEERLQHCINENEKLKEENDILKKRLQTVTEDNEKLRKSINPSMVTKATCLLSILLLFGLNFSTISIFKQSQDSSIIPSTIVHHSRSLLSYTENEAMLNSSQVESALRELHQMRNNSRDLMVLQDLDSALCPSYFNKTESLRLANELNGWVLGHKKEHIRKVEATKKKQKTKKRRKNKMNIVNISRREQRREEKPYQMQVFTGYDQSYYSLLNSINRRNDTFYVVSFKRDQLLLPATAHNKTMRPRMSLVMPALNLNASMQSPVGSIAMMQIDCEVMDTRLLYLRESVVPVDMRENLTQTVVMSAFNRQDYP